jgi:tRNA(Arg) A34 adenosine deaminase TadA
MATIYAKIMELAAADGGSRNIAGYLETTSTVTKTAKLHYVATKNLNLPAAAYVLDTMKTLSSPKAKVYTNLPADHWLTTYTDRTMVIAGDGLEKTTNVTEAVEIPAPTLSLIAGDRLGSTPVSGGLFDAALSLYNARTPVAVDGLGEQAAAQSRFDTGGPGSTGGESDELRGKKQALRYYMLAAYALLAICNESDHGGNFIAALMVNDQGQIVSYGVNSKGITNPWHHGEVNMLLNFFNSAGNQAKTNFGEKMLVFSTLTPCQQCAKYLQDSRPPDGKALIFIGQHDTGAMGYKGAEHGVFMHEVIKAPNWKIRTVERGVFAKEAVHIKLAQQMDSGKTVAMQIGTKGKTELLNAANTLVGKILKSRNDTAEQIVKQNVLNYLGMWLGTVNLGVRTVIK